MAYLYCWLVFVLMRALYVGYQNYKAFREAGYNQVLFEQTGQRVEFTGGFGKTVSCPLVSAFRQLFSPLFLVSTTLYFLPIAAGLLFLEKMSPS